jgi:NRAMP (natural resistance-associated macrophage protein)-like metal ion transporter
MVDSRESRPPPSTRSRTDTSSARAGAGWRAYLRAFGPGLVTGASDDDPSGIATYAQAGAQFKLGLLWTSLFTLPLCNAVQEICDRTALATGQSLGALAAKKFHRWRFGLGVLLGALIIANLLNITADVVAVGDGMNLLGLGPSGLWALAAGALVTTLVIIGSFEIIARVFKVFCVALLAYVVMLVVSNVSWADVIAHTLVPHIELTKGYMLLLVAVLGTTISPYLFFWQSAHRIEELRDEPEGGDTAVALPERASADAVHKQRVSRGDVFAGISLSNLVMFSIIVATGATLGAHGSQPVTSAAEAARALRPLGGTLSVILFALGFIGSGLLAIPVLAGAGSAGMAGLLHREWGFSRSPREAPVFYGLVVLGTIGGTLLTLTGVDPIQLLVFSALINGLLAAPFLVLVMLIANDKEIMGDYKNGPFAHTVGWITAALMAIAAIAYLVLSYGPVS